MQGLSELVAGELVRLVDFAGVQRVADIGGSGGTLMSAVLDAHADVGGILLDLPEVAEGARSVIEARGLAGAAMWSEATSSRRSRAVPTSTSSSRFCTTGTMSSA